MMLTENEKKEHIKQANIRRRTRHPEVFKKTIGEWQKKHPTYLKEWRSRNREKQRQYSEIWNKKHPNYMKGWNEKHPNYLKEWKKRNAEKQRRYREIWNERHPNYMKEYLKEWKKKHPNYMKEWKSNVKGINAGSRAIKIEGVDLAVVSESDKSIYREIDEITRKESASKRDEW